MDRHRAVAAAVVGVASTFLLARTASAAETGEWLVRAGVSVVAPESDNGTLDLADAIAAPASDIDVDDAPGFTFTVGYFFTPNVALELLAAYPFSHDFELEDINVGGEVDHLPPTLSLQYHLPIGETLKPYVGVGVNWTMFSNEDVDVPVDVSIEDSVGLALQTGVDMRLGDHWLLNLDVRYIEIEGDVEVEGVDVGSVEVNPLVFGLNLGYRF